MANTFVDRSILPVPGDTSVKPRYNLIRQDGTIVAENVALELVNEIVQQGTSLNAQYMNSLLGVNGGTTIGAYHMRAAGSSGDERNVLVFDDPENEEVILFTDCGTDKRSLALVKRQPGGTSAPEALMLADRTSGIVLWKYDITDNSFRVGVPLLIHEHTALHTGNVQSGSASISIPANSAGLVADSQINFNLPFGGSPKIFLQIKDNPVSDPNLIFDITPSYITSTGFKIWGRNNHATNALSVDYSWVAIA